MNKISKFFSIYKSLSNPVKASLFAVICSVIQKSISLITTPIFTRVLSKDEFGTFSVFLSWQSLLLILGSLNLYCGVYNNAMTKNPNDKARVTSSFLGLSVTISVMITIIYLINIDFWNNILGMSTSLVLMMLIEIIVQPAYLLWMQNQRFQYKYKLLVFFTLLTSILNPVLGVIAIKLTTNYKVEARVISSLIVPFIIEIVFFIYTFYKGKSFFNKKYWKYALKFNLPLIPHYLSMMILNQSDRIMIGKMVGNSDAALYSLAYTIGMVMTFVSTAINNSFIPYTYKSIKEKKYKAIDDTAKSLLIIVSGLSILTMALGPELVMILSNKAYYDAIWNIPPIAASVFFMFLYPLFGNIEFYVEKTKFIMVASCFGAIVNIILNYIFIPIFGYCVAGYTTLICYILFSLCHYLFYRKIVNDKRNEIQKIYSIKFILIISLIILIFMFIITVSYNFIILRFSIIVAILVAVIYKRKSLLNIVMKLKK